MYTNNCVLYNKCIHNYIGIYIYNCTDDENFTDLINYTTHILIFIHINIYR